tara:strand:- start:947 stop:3052 length:2106 start_codon:yes stop_codon:yes gene_type:complete
MSNTHSNSSFWYDFDQEDNVDILTGEEIKPGKDYVKMAATLRAISNFVRIVTGENIPVKYNNKDESFTDGKQVVISGNIKDKDFDPTVGLALHEGSHCKLTDFEILKHDNFIAYIENNFNIVETAKKYNHYETMWSEEQDKYINTDAINTRHAINQISSTLKQILNYVEDRRIDNFIYKSAPGYQGYYKALYDKYFHASVIDKALKSDEKTSLDLDSYMFRLINLTNINRNLDALPGLRKIWSILDLKNIDRLKNTSQALDVAAEIYKVIDSNIPETKDVEEQKDGGDNQKSSDDVSSSQESNGSSSKDLSQEDIDNVAKKIVEDDGSTSQGSSSKGTKAAKKIELTDSQRNSLEKAIQKQKELMGGKIKKSNLSKKDNNNVKAIQDSGSSEKTVGSGCTGRYYGTKSEGTRCLVVKNVTKSLIDSGVYSTVSKDYRWRTEDNEIAINEGLILGTKLGKKLQIRNDEKTLTYNRLNKGKLDKRLVSSLGYGYQSVFKQVFEERFNPAVVHISVDASGSMSGEKWQNSQKATVAIAKAASMVQNLDVVISYRSTENIGNEYLPAIFIAYDSRKDKVSKISHIFKYISCPGTTPEGLCFEAIQKELTEGSNGVDSFFINFSDGEPFFTNKSIEYYGQNAANHTKKQVENMRAKGIKVLSYFISGNYGSNSDDFKKMYGKDAEFINTNQLIPLANTLNKMFATA